MRESIMTGKTVEEATRLALAELGVAEEEALSLIHISSSSPNSFTTSLSVFAGMMMLISFAAFTGFSIMARR